MAQLPTTQYLAASVNDGIGRSITGIGSWSATAMNRIRNSVLPDRDEPVSVAASPNVPAMHRSHGQRLAALVPNIVIAFIGALFLIAVGLFVFRQAYADRIYPAVVVGDVNVGGLTIGEAEDRLTARATDLEHGTISFTYNGQTWTPTLAELGATVNLDDSLAEAEALGRSDDAAARLAFTGDILRANQVVPLQTEVDQRVLAKWYDGVDQDIANPAIDARIVVEGTDVSIAPDATGIVVDRELATAEILGALARLEPVVATLPTQVDQPAIVAADLPGVQAEVEEAIRTPIRVTFESRAWRIDGTTLAQYVAVDTILEAGAPVAKLSLDTERLAADLRAQFIPEVNRNPVDARVGWNNERGLVALDPSEPGITLKAGPFAEALAASFLNGHERVEIPVVVTRPEVDDENLGELGIDAHLGKGTSNFAGGTWARDENIYVSTGLLNGTLVPPGGEFSFNEAIGEITWDKGYQEASVVVAEQVGRGIGGGVCQLSTTMFRAAINAGMPITEWHPHSYRLPGYEVDGWGPGFDASILQYGSNPANWADFRFENFTDGWLLVESWTTWPHVVVNIYGMETGRDVEVKWWGISGGKNTGFTRVIYDADGNVLHERAFATYFK